MKKILWLALALLTLVTTAHAQIGTEYAPLFDRVVDEVGYDMVMPHPEVEGAYLVTYHTIAFWADNVTFVQVGSYDYAVVDAYFEVEEISICDSEMLYNEAATRRVKGGRQIVNRGLLIFYRC